MSKFTSAELDEMIGRLRWYAKGPADIVEQILSHTPEDRLRDLVKAPLFRYVDAYQRAHAGEALDGGRALDSAPVLVGTSRKVAAGRWWSSMQVNLADRVVLGPNLHKALGACTPADLAAAEKVRREIAKDSMQKAETYALLRRAMTDARARFVEDLFKDEAAA
jgi:hypothetical protein